MFNLAGYREATTVSEAVALLADDPNLMIIAGGTDVLVKIRGGKIAAAELLSIRRISELTKVRQSEDGTIRIGALSTFAQLAKDPLIEANIPVMVQAALSMGGPQIRNMATLGGNLCNGAPSADSAPALLIHNAKLTLESSQGSRILPIQEFFAAPGQVRLQPGELLTEITIEPRDYKNLSASYLKFGKRRAMDIAVLGVAVACAVEDSCFTEVRIGLGVAAPIPIRCSEAEDYAKGQPVGPESIREISQRAVDATKARTSWRASREYREHLVQVLVQKALETLLRKAEE